MYLFIGPCPLLAGGAHPLHYRQTFNRPRSAPRVRAQNSGSKVNDAHSTSTVKRTEDVFAEDAGKDLFFTAMDMEKAIELIDTPCAKLEEWSDRYIAAERLKFYPSEESTKALIRCIQDDENNDQGDRIAKRKAIESLGRYEGEFHRELVLSAVTGKLSDPDPFTVENVAWTLAKLRVEDEETRLKIVDLLSRDDINKRVVIQTLSSLNIVEAASKIREFLEDDDLATRCGAIGALSKLTGDPEVMRGVVDILKSPDLNVRRAALEDITNAKYFPALESIGCVPNSLVLKSRAVREILDPAVMSGEREWDEELEIYIDQLIWDHPQRIDYLETRADTKKARSIPRCVQRLYKNDALASYLGAKVLIEDYQGDQEAGQAVLDSFEAMKYFDYFAAYHVFKALGWLQFKPAAPLLLDNFRSLPPRFFNHQAGAALSLALLNEQSALKDISELRNLEMVVHFAPHSQTTMTGSYEDAQEAIEDSRTCTYNLAHFLPLTPLQLPIIYFSKTC